MLLRALSLVIIAALSAGCTVIKPVVCGIVYPVLAIKERIDHPLDDDDDEDYNDLPTVLSLLALPVLLPLDFGYLTVRSTVAGLYTGLASDLNALTGNATLNSTMDSLLRPTKTNALPRPE